MKILLTGFEPFGGDERNPSWEAVEGVANVPAGVTVVKKRLPVVFYRAADELMEAIRAERPDAVISVGLAGGRQAVTVERIAVNLADGRIPDNAGQQPCDETLYDAGENAYFATLPIRKIVSAMQAAGIPAAISNSAGLYVCNNVMYAALFLAAAQGRGMRAGFIHLPYLPEQAKDGASSLSLADDIRALETAVACTAEVISRN